LFFFSSRRRHTRFSRDWSSDVCSSDLVWTGLFMVAAIVLLVQLARDVQWHEVWQVLQRMSNTALLESACLVPVAYVAYSAFDLIDRKSVVQGKSGGQSGSRDTQTERAR